MNVNFGAQTTEAPEVPSYVTPSQGVGKDMSWMTSAAQMFGDVEGIVKTENENRANSTVAEFTRQQLLIAEGVSQGKFSSVHAATKMRHNLINAITSNPALQGDFVKAQSSILNITGGAKVVDEGTKEEQRKEARFDYLVQNNLIPADATDEEFNKADTYMREAKAAQDRFEQRMNTLNLESKELNLSAERRRAIEEERKAESHRYLADLAPAQFQGMQVKLDQIINGAGTEAEKVQAIEDVFISFRSGLTSIVGDLSSTESSALLTPFDMLKENYVNKATGALSDAELKRSVERTMMVSKKMALSDPRIAKLAVASELFPGVLESIAVLNQDSFSAALEYMPSLTDDEADTPDPYVKNKAKKEAFKLGNEAIVKGLTSDDPATKAAAIKGFNRVLEGAEDSGNKIARDPMAAQQVVDFFASPDFLKAIKNDGVSSDALAGAADIISRHYADEVWGMVRNEFRDNRIFDESIIEKQEMGKPRQLIGEGAQQQAIPADPTVPTKEMVLYKVTTSGIQFYAADKGNGEAVQRARELNKDLKPVINKTIRASAHLEGRSDYGAVLNEVLEQTMTGGVGEGKVAGGDAGDDVSMDDFQTTVTIPDQHENVNTVASTLSSELDLKEHHIAGVLANFVVESGSKNLNPTAVGDNGNAFGIAQWNGDRMKALKSWATAQGLDHTSIDTQVKFLVHELQTSESKAYAKLLEATTAEEAAAAFSKWFERPGVPHLSRRKSEATRIYNLMNG